MTNELVELGKYVPLDKSYVIRAAVLDLLDGRDDTRKYLAGLDLVSSDLQSVRRLENRSTESATLYRFMTFAGWVHNDTSLFMNKLGTLRDRLITINSDIVNWSQEELLKLDDGTSQWASAAAICGDPWRLKDPPAKLQLTYDVIQHWKRRLLVFGPDPTIYRQMEAFDAFHQSGQITFDPQHSEDYCFARAFGVMTQQQGRERWPSLRGHESNRISGMEEALREMWDSRAIWSNDHRIVQALAMVNGAARFENPGCVIKSWPLFWEYLDQYPGFQGRLD